MNGEITADNLKQLVGENNNKKTISRVAQRCQFCGMLVVTHHRLPEKDIFVKKIAPTLKKYLR